ncbi:LptF/LptG family permease [Marivirga sp. S37H4]|uniref:LptF/LptG family permease n=1 Tax=Marivirga aurantiaca TaxID=2802615 RepID=A0A934WWP5_9BACT|nr:LptF/LptG family permease [Marivirga aurantiaca]MBK6264215.1 LptF/LptG family permease [Marivirga aurantiaca]
MKKLDKLILKSFIGPFLITFFVVVFILLTQYMLKYFDDFVGKDLGFNVFVELISYFSINMTPIAFPLAVLLSSLMTFGNLGEHFELTAIKSAGISLIRAMRPLFFFVIILTCFVYYSNNYIVPKANLDAYSLLYDIKQKKPSIDIKEGAFYGGIPGYSIKANTKYDDDKSLGDLIIYNHSKGKGNNEVILADSALMYTILGDKYLVMELFDGKSYTEEENTSAASKDKPATFVRNKFQHNKVIFSLASFEMERTDKDLFSSNRLMKNEAELRNDVDSMRRDILESKRNLYLYTPRFFNLHLSEVESIKPESVVKWEEFKKERDSAKMVDAEPLIVTDEKEIIIDSAVIPNKLQRVDESIVQEIKKPKNNMMPEKERFTSPEKKLKPLPSDEAKLKAGTATIQTYDSAIIARVDSAFDAINRGTNMNLLDKPRFAKNRLKGENRRIESREFESNVYGIEANSKLSQAIACIVMFLIGAPLGAIIKKGGLGFPVILSILFFIISYVINTTGIKMGRQGDISNFLAVWASNIILLPFGLFFLRQARNDSRLFELDNYLVFFGKVKGFFTGKKA